MSRKARLLQTVTVPSSNHTGISSSHRGKAWSIYLSFTKSSKFGCIKGAVHLLYCAVCINCSPIVILYTVQYIVVFRNPTKNLTFLFFLKLERFCPFFKGWCHEILIAKLEKCVSARVDQIFQLSCLRRHVLGWVKKRLHSYSNFFKVRFVVGTHFSHISSQNRFCLFISDPGGGFF